MRRLGLAALLTALMAAAPARAEDYEATGGTERAYKHGGQLKLYSQLGASYRIIFRYNADDYCGEAAKSFCRTFPPAWVELGAGFGVTNSFEILADVRLGLGEDFVPDTSTGGGRSGPRALVVAPGVRIFIDDTGSLKFFTTFQLAIDLTDFSTSAVSTSTDLGLRNVNGLLVDLHRTIGIYAHVGTTFGFIRWFRFEIDGGIGLMVRLP
jgi:hypothetical protein